MIAIVLHLISIFLLLTILSILLFLILRIKEAEVEEVRRKEVVSKPSPPSEYVASSEPFEGGLVISGDEKEELEATGHLDTIEEQEWKEEQKRLWRMRHDL